MNASTKLSMNGKSAMISEAPPFVPSSSSGRALRLSKDERRVFQRNRLIGETPHPKKLSLDSRDAEEHFQLGLKVFSDNGKFSEDSLRRLVLRSPKALERVNLTDLVDWSFLPR